MQLVPLSFHPVLFLRLFWDTTVRSSHCWRHLRNMIRFPAEGPLSGYIDIEILSGYVKLGCQIDITTEESIPT